MSCVTLAAATTVEEEASLALQYPWQCWSQDQRVFEEFPSIEAMARAKGVSVSIIQAAIAYHGGNFGDMHFVQR